MRFFSLRKGQLCPLSNNILIINLLSANCFRCSFLINYFLTVNLWVRIPFQVGDSHWHSSSIYASIFTKCSWSILKLNLTSILCCKLYGHDWLQTCRYKTREPCGSSAEFRGKSVVEFRSYFCKNGVSDTILIYSINRPGSLLNFWSLRVGTFSRWLLIQSWVLKFSPFSACKGSMFILHQNNKW